jgi:site-specific DNA-methyltransferase (adenine-specific)
MIKLYCGDCLKEMENIPDKSIDMVLADPPYGTTACKWDSIIPLEPMWEQLKRVIKKNGAIVMTASQPFTTTLISSNMGMFKYCWYWKKTKAIGFQHAKNKPMKIIEECCVFSKAPMGHVSQLKEKRMEYNPQDITKLKEKTVSAVWHGNIMGARPNQVGNKYMAYTNFPNDLFLDFK